MNSEKNNINHLLQKDVQLIELSDDRILLNEAKKLLREYGDYMYEDLKLIAGKESFFKDIEHFPGDNYMGLSGMFVVAKAENTLLGCVGVKKFDGQSYEMKRMYIRPPFRGRGIGKILCNYVIEWCRKSVYRRILLDTNKEMKEAIILYHKCGFKEIEPYCVNENNHPVYMEYLL